MTPFRPNQRSRYTTGVTSTLPAVEEPRGSLHRGLSLRHIQFIALGSAIGTGLFLGSGEAIQFAGPSVLLAYVLGGAAVYLVMRAMGEMAMASPVAGAFSEYASKYLGPWAGFVTGWSYAFEMALVAVADVTAVAIYMQFWFPGTPSWIWIASVLLVLLAVNLAKVGVFGELEFWFTIIKVSAILAMILGGLALLVFGVSFEQGASPSVAHLWDQGGFFGHGLGGFVSCFTVVMFAFGGVETIGITAGEAENPRRAIPQAINTVPVRILLFYVLTMAVIMSLAPWSGITSDSSPFVQIFSTLGIPFAAHLLNFVVLTSAVSAINADIYGAGRMLFGLAQRGMAPAAFGRVSAQGIPFMTVISTIVVLLVGVLVNVLFENAFLVVASLATFATVQVWVMILLAHLGFRRRLARTGQTSQYPAPGGAAGTWLALLFMLAVVVQFAFFPDTRQALVVGAVWCLLLGGVYALVRPHLHAAPAATASSDASEAS